MNNVKMHFRDPKLWNRSGQAHSRGRAYLDTELLAGSDLSAALSREETFDGFVSLLRRLNGFFAGSHQIDDQIFLAVDHVRSFPLFYGTGATVLYVSDDPHWIRRELNEYRVDELSAAEFMLAGYVTGDDTLSPGVKQLQAGEALAIQFASGRFQVTPARYYDHERGQSFNDSREQLLAELDRALIGPFERLIRMAGGRTIVVPLSGGCDSRLVVLMLNRLGYDKIVAFSYGKHGNEETRISKSVASSLGIPWEFVPYSKNSWRKWRCSEEWNAYCQVADGLSSVPHIQDWPAVWILGKQQLIPKDSIFVPGHLAAHLLRYPSYPPAWTKPGVTEDDVFNSICEAFYTWRDWSHVSTGLRLRLFEKMRRLLGTQPSYTTEQATEAYERWWWQGYEAKHVINSVRVYDFWGYDWWLPLWDLEIAGFWNRVSVAHRLEKNLQRAHLQRIEATVPMPNLRQHGTRSRPFSVFIRLLGESHLYRPSLRLFGLSEYVRHPMAWYGILPRKRLAFLYSWNPDIYYYLAVETLQRNFPEWKQVQNEQTQQQQFRPFVKRSRLV